MVKDEVSGFKQRGEAARTRGSVLAAVAVVINWVGGGGVWTIVAFGFLIVAFAFVAQGVAFRVRERRAAGLSTRPLAIAAASISIEGLVIVAVIAVAAVALNSF